MCRKTAKFSGLGSFRTRLSSSRKARSHTQVEHKPKRQIARELGHARTRVDKALGDAASAGYHLSQLRSVPVLGPVKAQIDAWVAENETLPRKQRYTSHTIFQKLQAGEYARDDDGDSFHEVHVNILEGFWSLLCSWPRPHRGISHEILPLYLSFFEFIHNVRRRGKAALASLLTVLVAP